MSTFSDKNALSQSPYGFQQTELKADLDQMFLLIEGILPFEACLYYQVLPLSIQGSTLNLGMVSPEDTNAADYVRRLVSYINCSIVSRPISSDWHREILSKFLSHSAKNRQASQVSQPKSSAADTAFEELPTQVVGAPTEIIENPRAVLTEDTPPPPNPPKPLAEVLQQNDPNTNATSEASSQAPLSIELEPEADAIAVEKTAKEPNLETQTETRLNLKQASPKDLTQNLLKRIITQEGIGRFYLERQSATGRILWSKDGVLQSMVDNISPQLFQGVINELKRTMSLALIPVRKPKQIEIERIYNQKRILLRFRVMPGEHGEEATLQVLRGAALKFYQQQQVDNIGRDALSIAHDLQQRISDLRTQAQRNLDVQDTKQKTLPAIVSMLRKMEQQLNDIIDEPD